MPPTDDAFALQVLARIKKMGHEIEHLRDHAHAREFKARLVKLRESCRSDCVPADVDNVVATFVDLAHQMIVRLYGTSAWDDAETIEEATARMGSLPAAAGDERRRPTENELKNLRNYFTDLPDLDPLPATIACEVVRVIDEALRLRSDDWLQRAVEEVAMISVTDWDRMSISECEDRLLAVLQRRRDGKA
jgi:hypothetical protein